jgi:hypothetical protein
MQEGSRQLLRGRGQRSVSNDWRRAFLCWTKPGGSPSTWARLPELLGKANANDLFCSHRQSAKSDDDKAPTDLCGSMSVGALTHHSCEGGRCFRIVASGGPTVDPLLGDGGELVVSGLLLVKGLLKKAGAVVPP